MKHIKGTINSQLSSDSGFDLHPVFPQLEPNFKSLGERVCCVLQTLGTAHMHRSKKVRDFEMFTATQSEGFRNPKRLVPALPTQLPLSAAPISPLHYLIELTGMATEKRTPLLLLKLGTEASCLVSRLTKLSKNFKEKLKKKQVPRY